MVREQIGPRFTNGFSIAIQIRWKCRFTLISILIQWSLQNFVHGTKAVLVVACAKICCDLMASNRITARRNFRRIWIAGKKWLVKRAPGLQSKDGTEGVKRMGLINQSLINQDRGIMLSMVPCRYHISRNGHSWSDPRWVQSDTVWSNPPIVYEPAGLLPHSQTVACGPWSRYRICLLQEAADPFFMF